MSPKSGGEGCEYTQIDTRGGCYEMREVWGEWKIIEKFKKAAARGKNDPILFMVVGCGRCPQSGT